MAPPPPPTTETRHSRHRPEMDPIPVRQLFLASSAFLRRFYLWYIKIPMGKPPPLRPNLLAECALPSNIPREPPPPLTLTYLPPPSSIGESFFFETPLFLPEFFSPFRIPGERLSLQSGRAWHEPLSQVGDISLDFFFSPLPLRSLFFFCHEGFRLRFVRSGKINRIFPPGPRPLPSDFESTSLSREETGLFPEEDIGGLPAHAKEWAIARAAPQTHGTDVFPPKSIACSVASAHPRPL